MKKLLEDASILEQRAIKAGISEELMMENAGKGLAKACKKYKNILFLLSGGSNSADALVAARMLKNSTCMLTTQKQSKAFLKQYLKSKALGVKFVDINADLSEYDCIVDALFGTGLNKGLLNDHLSLIRKVNKTKAVKIACDLPSGLGFGECFKADLTLCMGVLKKRCFEDYAKASVGKVKLCDLGFHPSRVGFNSEYFKLEKKDLRLVKRKTNSHKGSYGHVLVLGSSSAGSLSALAALCMGAGKASLKASSVFSPLLIQVDKLVKASVYAAGMGLSDLSFLDDEHFKDSKLVLDAGVFDSLLVLKHLYNKTCVLTPHPKEFCKLYKLAFNKTLSVESLQAGRFEYAKEFSKAFPCILVLKGANTLVAKKGRVFVISQGSSALAKGGSGDVLSGVITAHLANFPPLKAVLTAVLAHALASKDVKSKSSFNALKLIKRLGKLKENHARA